MYTMMMNSNIAENIREMLTNNVISVRKVRKSLTGPISLFSAGKEYNGINYCTINGVLMPR